MDKLGLSCILLVLLSSVPAAFAGDDGLSGLSRPTATGLVRLASRTACPFRRFPWLCHPSTRRRPH